MKTICFTFFFFFSFLYSQNTKVTYKVTLNDYSNFPSQQIKEHFKTTEFATDYALFDLIYNSDEMFFSAKKVENLSDEEFENLLLMCDMDGGYYKQNNDVFLYRVVPETKDIKNLICKSKVVTNWKLSDEKKIILGYECKRADSMVYIDYGDGESISTYTVTAWYCKDIKCTYGPKGFGGLDGLILELNQNLVTYTAIKLEEYPNIFPFKMYPELKIIDEKDFFNYFRKLRNKE
jgi:GLPGLI family protein